MSTPETDAPDLEPADALVREMGDVTSGDLIPLLQRLQETYGYLPPPVLAHVSEITRIPPTQFYGVATFYAQFYLEPKGKHTVRCCRGTACHVRGAVQVLDAVQKLLKINDGETTDDLMFSLETVACLGTCALAPVVVVDDTYCGKATPESVEQTLSAIMAEESQEKETA